MQREALLDHVLIKLEQYGLAASLPELLQELDLSPQQLHPFWPDRDALIFDCLRHHGQQIDIWQRQVMLDENLTVEQKLLARYDQLAMRLEKNRFPGCLFVAACSAYPDEHSQIHQLSQRQKQSSFDYSRALLRQLDIEDDELVAKQMELILEGCLSRLMVNHHSDDITTAKLLAQDILKIAQCRKNGALS
ncbi:TPA: transcriptional regulator [Escherichia coli]|uniref:TetR family transcriptional regulator n=1 Tax=Proteus hauseri ATCC 700826 TaxID=1354271 RepID=A0AAJ3LSH2_PROHU|nr:transcriptional regulator [Proteus hauseri]OAT45057.1 TetR family transcriptional regulator [Proteus hauseri ATCC 700826]HCH50850.1 transcriptional regulator [Proteus sp. (in: enterobacteria)]HDH9217862.1 transcriptional regulator [Escherichia coli]